MNIVIKLRGGNPGVFENYFIFFLPFEQVSIKDNVNSIYQRVKICVQIRIVVNNMNKEKQ